MKFNLICIQSHNERPSKLNIDKKLKLIQSEFENIYIISMIQVRAVIIVYLH